VFKKCIIMLVSLVVIFLGGTGVAYADTGSASTAPTTNFGGYLGNVGLQLDYVLAALGL
jgi:hypothetical protein